MSAARRLVWLATRRRTSRGLLTRESAASWRNNSGVRPLALTSSEWAKSNEPADEPMKFSTSKASHRVWKVHSSMGSQHQRPWWKVLPLSLLGVGLLLWCALREETDIDAKLEKQLFEHLPGLLPEEEEGQGPDKSS